MPRGMALPIQTLRNGRTRLVQGTPYLRQSIQVGLNPNTSRNPFQLGDGEDVGISERIVFMVNDPTAVGFVRAQIVRLFKRFRDKDLAKLAPGKEGLSFRSEGGELTVSVGYVDLEAERGDRIEVNVSNTLKASPLQRTG